MGLYFCNNLVLRKEALKMAYICKQTKQICPRVKYSVTGEASPDILFTLRGCKLLKSKEETKVGKKTSENNDVEKDKKEEMEVTEVIETTETTEEEQNKNIEVKENKKIEETEQKQSNYNRKKKRQKNK